MQPTESQWNIFNAREPRPLGWDEKKHAAVLIPLIRKENGWHILFQVRSENLHHQPGDVCFPGGGSKEGETALETAVRETCEELLVAPRQIRILGPADYMNHFRMIVSPYVGELIGYEDTFNPDEVEEVFTVPVSFFMENEPSAYTVESVRKFPEDFPFHKIYHGRDYPWVSSRENIYFWEYDGHVIWGMSAAILRGVIRVLQTSAEGSLV